MCKICIITPAKEFDSMLKRAVTSLQNNCSDDLRITHVIVFDNYYPKDIKLIAQDNFEMIIKHNIGNRGPSATRNIGLSFLDESYDYFGFLDADDYLSDDYIMKNINVIQSNDCSVTFGQGISVNMDDHCISFSNVPIRSGSVANRLIFANIIGCPSGLIINNSKENRAVRFDEKLRFMEDYFYYLHLCENGNWFYKTDAKYFYRVHEGQATNTATTGSLKAHFSILREKITSEHWTFFFEFLVNLRINLSFYRLSKKSMLSGILSGVGMGIICPEWALGRMKMKLRHWKK